jgi:hypothetical protein
MSDLERALILAARSKRGGPVLPWGVQAEIARRFGMVPSTVHRVAKALGLKSAGPAKGAQRKAGPCRRWTEAEDAELKARIEAGQTAKDIAKAMPGRSVKAIYERAIAWGIYFKRYRGGRPRAKGMR